MGLGGGGEREREHTQNIGEKTSWKTEKKLGKYTDSVYSLKMHQLWDIMHRILYQNTLQRKRLWM